MTTISPIAVSPSNETWFDETELAIAKPATAALNIREVIEGLTAARLIVAADDFGWWTSLLNGENLQLTSRIEEVVADGLVRAGFLTRECDGRLHALTMAGHEVALNRGFVRVAVNGWAPTFDQLPESAAGHHIPAKTKASEVARGCTDIASRRPDIFHNIAVSLRASGPGHTIDLGCSDAGRIKALGLAVPGEKFTGVDIEPEVVACASANLHRTGLTDRVKLFTGSVDPSHGRPAWLDQLDTDKVTTAMSFFLLHQLASDGDGIAGVLRSWGQWFPNLQHLVIGDGVLQPEAAWVDQPWFTPTYELYHELTGVHLWTAEEYDRAFLDTGWKITKRIKDHTMMVTTVLERV